MKFLGPVLFCLAGLALDGAHCLDEPSIPVQRMIRRNGDDNGANQHKRNKKLSRQQNTVDVPDNTVDLTDLVDGVDVIEESYEEGEAEESCGKACQKARKREEQSEKRASHREKKAEHDLTQNAVDVDAVAVDEPTVHCDKACQKAKIHAKRGKMQEEKAAQGQGGSRQGGTRQRDEDDTNVAKTQNEGGDKTRAQHCDKQCQKAKLKREQKREGSAGTTTESGNKHHRDRDATPVGEGSTVGEAVVSDEAADQEPLSGRKNGNKRNGNGRNGNRKNGNGLNGNGRNGNKRNSNGRNGNRQNGNRNEASHNGNGTGNNGDKKDGPKRLGRQGGRGKGGRNGNNRTNLEGAKARKGSPRTSEVEGKKNHEKRAGKMTTKTVAADTKKTTRAAPAEKMTTKMAPAEKMTTKTAPATATGESAGSIPHPKKARKKHQLDPIDSSVVDSPEQMTQVYYGGKARKLKKAWQ